MSTIVKLVASIRAKLKLKALAGPVGVVAEGVSLGVFHGQALAAATAAIAIATYLGIYHAPYSPSK